MRNIISLLLVSVVFLSGCNSRANPTNWFGNAAPDERNLDPIDDDNPLIPDDTNLLRRPDLGYEGTTIDAVSDLTLERVPGGVLIRATGQSATLGAFNARLIPLDPDEQAVDGVLSYELRAEYAPQAGGPPESREVIVARKLTDQELGDTRVIRVSGLQNSLERRRR